MTTLKFGLEEFDPVKPTIDDDYEQVKADRFQKVKIKLFGDGDNAHTEDVDMETLKVSADSAYDIPLIAELNPYRQNEDFGGHGVLTGSEFSFGFIKESNDNPIKFEKDERTGKTFITLYGLIWKKYFENIIDIIKRNRDEVEVSVELDIVKGKTSKRGKPIMKQFVLNAVTFLGKITTAACKGAMAQLAFSEDDLSKFAEDKKNYLEGKFEDNSIEISNNKETAVNGKWTNPRQKLLAPILKASNKTELLNEAYLFYKDEGEEGITVSDVSYPHHIIKDGKLVLHIKGVQSAFARLSQQGEDKGKAKAHLIRHYKTLGLNRENFEDFGLTSEQFELYFSTEFGKEEVMSEETKDFEKTTDTEEEVVGKIKESEKVDEESILEEEQGCDKKMEDDDKTEDSENHDSEDGNDDDTKDEDKEEEMSEEPEITFEMLKEENEKLKKDNEAYMAKIKEMSDYEDLKKFKADTLEKEAKMAEAVEMANVMKSLEEKGVKMSEKIKEELTQKRDTFANTSAWANYVKAYVFDNCEISNNDDGIIKFDIVESVKDIENSDSNNVWASLKNKFTI